jgi:hypothetical protein
MATQTYDFPHSLNSDVVTRVVLTDVSAGVLNYTVSLVRKTDSVQSFNLNPSGNANAARTGNITIFGQSVANTAYYTFDWFYSLTQTVSLTSGSAILRNIPRISEFRVGMTRQSGIGIPANTSITVVGSTNVSMSAQATSTRNSSVNFSRPLRTASVPIASGNLNDSNKFYFNLNFEFLNGCQFNCKGCHVNKDGAKAHSAAPITVAMFPT